MSKYAPESLAAHFEPLHADRVQTWAPAQLVKNIETRQALVAAFDAVKIGDRVDSFGLADSAYEGATFHSRSIEFSLETDERRSQPTEFILSC